MPKTKKRIDPRVIRTRTLLRQALIALIPQHGFNTITIQQITDQATLNRATFYLHYRDKDELLLDVFETLISENIPLPPDAPNSSPPETTSPIVPVFNHLADYADFYCAILGEQGVPIFMTRVRNIIEELIQKWLTAVFPASLQDPQEVLPEIVVNYLGAAYLGVITWWLQNGMPYSAEEMEIQLLKLTNRGVSSLLES